MSNKPPQFKYEEAKDREVKEVPQVHTVGKFKFELKYIPPNYSFLITRLWANEYNLNQQQFSEIFFAGPQK